MIHHSEQLTRQCAHIWSDNLHLPCVQPPTSSYNRKFPHGHHGHHGRHGHGAPGGHGGHVGRGGHSGRSGDGVHGGHGVYGQDRTGQDRIGQAKLTFKLDFPGNL